MIEGEARKESHLSQEPEDIDVGENFESQLNDPARSLDKGLVTLYDKYLARIDRQRETGLIDRVKADELANSVLALVEKDGLENEIGYTSTEEAKEIMGPYMFFGPEEVKKAGIEIREEIPPIPFNPEELERARELGQMLIYRTSTKMKELNDTIGLKLEVENKGYLIYDTNWYKDEAFYKSEKIQPGWALVSKGLTVGSINNNYLDQSEHLTEYLIDEVFQGKPLPREYQEAVDQLNTHKENIRQLIDRGDYDGRQEAIQMLSNLKINQLFRQSPAEVIYDFVVYFQNTGQRLRKVDNVWINVFADASLALLVFVGKADDIGSCVVKRKAAGFPSNVGTSFCRRGSDLKS